MTIAYFDCFNGASGDMIVGALLGAGADLARLREDLAALGLEGVAISTREIERQGIVGTKFDVVVRGQQESPAELFRPHDQGHHEPGHEHPHHDHGHQHQHQHDHHHQHQHDHHDHHHDHHDHHHQLEHHHEHRPHHAHAHHHEHRTLADVEARLAKLPSPAREQAIAIFRRLADAEARVHGETRDAVHFHEVGQDDAIVDIASAVLCLQQLGVTEVRCSALPMGSGMIRCAHGLMPVPVPAVAELVRGIPTYDNGEPGELVTPTGAAILATLATHFGPAPAWRPGPVGYGAGGREGKRIPNLLRVTIGEPLGAAADRPAGEAPGEPEIQELQANIDDLNPQFYGPLTEKLLATGALDVTLTPTLMKKGRPGIVLAVLCPAPLLDACCELVFRETTTLGLRHHAVSRRVLERAHHTVATPWGDVRVKVGSLAGQPVNVAPEYEDCRRVAEAAGQPVKEVWQEALAAARRAGLAAGGPHG